MSALKRPRHNTWLSAAASAASSAARSAAGAALRTGLRTAGRRYVQRTLEETLTRPSRRARYGVGTHLVSGHMRPRRLTRLGRPRRLFPRRLARSSGRAFGRRRARTTYSSRRRSYRRRFARRRPARRSARLNRSAVLNALAPSITDRFSRGNGLTTGVYLYGNAQSSLPGFPTDPDKATVGRYGYSVFRHHGLGGLKAWYDRLDSTWGSIMTPTLAAPIGHGSTGPTYAARHFIKMRVSPRLIRLEIANTSGSAVTLEAFVCKLKRYATSLATFSARDPVYYAASAWQYSAAHGSNANVQSRVDPLDVGVDFWKSPDFSRFFTCRRAFGVRLSHGQTTFERIRIPGFVYRPVDEHLMLNGQDSRTDNGPMTHFIVYRLKGQAGGIKSVGGDVFPSATFSSASVHMVLNFMTTYRAVPFVRGPFTVSGEIDQSAVTFTEGDIENQVYIANEYGSGDVVQPGFLPTTLTSS